MLRTATWRLIATLLLALGPAGLAHAGAASVTATPASGGGGKPLIFGHAEFDLATVGYAQSEFLIEGRASAFAPAAPLERDGRWKVEPTSPAPYRTRLLVNRPVDPRRFSGTVVVEWLNVSGGVDASPDWQHMHVELIRAGHAWVGVSAQWVGVHQLAHGIAQSPGDPARYGSLRHPGDSWSYDIFSQAGQAVREQAALLLGGLEPARLIAAGESQSASRLVTYINAVHPRAKLYDAFVVHSRGDDGAPLSQALAGRDGSPAIATPDVPAPLPTLIRDDLDVPVMVLANENDAGSFLARQDDGPLYRLWEVAGTAHFDLYGLVQAATDTGEPASVEAWFRSMRSPSAQAGPGFRCELPVNTGPATFVMRALVRALHSWLVEGTPAPRAPRLETTSVDPLAFGTDAAGNVLGGIRTPAVDAPVARLNGLGQGQGQASGGSASFCRLFGVTAPLSDAQLRARYGDRDGFLSAWREATHEAVEAGFLLPDDAEQILSAAAQSDVLIAPAPAASGEGLRHIAVPNPEDLIALPDSEKVIVSAMAQHGAGGGAIVAVDRRTGAASRVFPDGEASGPPPDGSACSGPPDSGAFAPHGIALVPGEGLELYVVNHGAREAVEILALSREGGGLRGRWIDCIPLPEGAMGNAVAVVGETVFVTNNAKALDAARADIGATDVLMWSAAEGWRQVAPLHFPVPNGLVAAPGGERIWAAVWIGKELVELRPGSGGADPRRVSLPFLPDNVRWDSDGALLVAGQDATEELITECYYGSKSPCPARSAIARVDPETMELICHRSFPATERFGGATVAAPVGESLWLGQSHGAAILVVPRLTPPGPGGGC